MTDQTPEPVTTGPHDETPGEAPEQVTQEPPDEVVAETTAGEPEQTRLRRKLPVGWLYAILAVLLAIVVTPMLICCGPPLLTGQACVDFLSSHVPNQAQRRFLDGVFKAIIAQDYAWLETVSKSGALDDIGELQPHVSKDYTVILRDSLGSLYEFRVRFADGRTAYITLRGDWEQCPDFRVTDDEVFTNIVLSSIRLEPAKAGD